MRKRFKKLYSADPFLQKMQDAISESFQGLDELPQLDSNLVMSVNLISGQDNYISHGLNRSVIGWHVIDKNANTDIWKSTTENKSPSSLFVLKTTVTCTASFLFF